MGWETAHMEKEPTYLIVDAGRVLAPAQGPPGVQEQQGCAAADQRRRQEAGTPAKGRLHQGQGRWGWNVVAPLRVRQPPPGPVPFQCGCTSGSLRRLARDCVGLAPSDSILCKVGGFDGGLKQGGAGRCLGLGGGVAARLTHHHIARSVDHTGSGRSGAVGGHVRGQDQSPSCRRAGHGFGARLFGRTLRVRVCRDDAPAQDAARHGARVCGGLEAGRHVQAGAVGEQVEQSAEGVGVGGNEEGRVAGCRVLAAAIGCPFFLQHLQTQHVHRNGSRRDDHFEGIAMAGLTVDHRGVGVLHGRPRAYQDFLHSGEQGNSTGTAPVVERSQARVFAQAR